MASDHVILKGARFYGYHGVNPEEKAQGQSYIVDLEAELDLAGPGKSDNLEDTVSYTLMYRAMRSVMEGESHNLLESLAENIAAKILSDLPIEAVTVTVKKPSPPIKGSFIDHAAVRIVRRRTSA